MRVRTAVAGILTTVLLVLSGCSANQPDREPVDDYSWNTDAPSPPTTPATSPRVFTQTFAKAIDGEPARISISSAPTSKKFRADNIGISFESTVLADARLDPARSNLDELLKSLGHPALRFGGNELDRRLFWTSTGEKAPKSNQVVVTPTDLKRLKKLVDVTGSRVTLGIPLGTYAPKRGADMAAHAVDILGDSLIGLAIGNEPNGYTVTSVPNGAVRDKGWNTTAYVKQLEAYATAIHAKRPKAPIIGPDAYDGAWMEAFADSTVTHKAAISQHWYQLYQCDSSAVPGRGPQAANLIDPLAKTSAAKILGIGLDKAKAADLPLWLEETGTTSCPGTNDTSRTHASALWAVDYSLNVARLGVQRMAMHSSLGACLGGAPMSLVCDPADHGTKSDSFAGRPHFYGMRLLVPDVGGTFLNSSVTGGGNLSAYAVKKDGRILLTVVNKNDAAKSGGNAVQIDAPQGFRVTKASQISAPSNAARNQTRVTPTAHLPKSPAYHPPLVAGDPSAAKGTTLGLDIAASSATVFVLEKN